MADTSHDDRAGTAGEEGDPPLLPAYGLGCLTDLAGLLLGPLPATSGSRPVPPCERQLPPWAPAPLRDARQVVLLVLDGLGHLQLASRRRLAPQLASMLGGHITSVAPSTTATALTSIATGAVPARHGVVGYRIRTPSGSVLNVLRWRTDGEDARRSVPPAGLQPLPPFGGHRVPVVSPAAFAGSGFTEAHLRGTQPMGWHLPSSIPLEVGALLREGYPFVYAYYDGVDKIAHAHGLADHYDAELVATDRLVGDLASVLPPGCALVVTADHGQVEVTAPRIHLAPELADLTTMLSGEGRWRWLHARPGRTADAAALAAELYGDVAWVVTRDEIVEGGWLGGVPSAEVAARLGDVALVARQSVAFADPADEGEARLVSRHGSLTAAEMLVPLLAWRA